MLQDSDFFDKLPEWMNIGEDVRIDLRWEESPSPDERYAVSATWQYQGEQIGDAQYVIEPIFGTDEFRLWWVSLRFDEAHQRQGYYTRLMDTFVTHMPVYGITEIVAVPWDKDSEKALASRGFKWRGNVFVADLVAPHQRRANAS